MHVVQMIADDFDANRSEKNRNTYEEDNHLVHQLYIEIKTIGKHSCTQIITIIEQH